MVCRQNKLTRNGARVAQHERVACLRRLKCGCWQSTARKE